MLEKEFFEFIYKRHLIWYKRFKLHEEPPWTSDEILKTYKIINIYRELDKCTIYIVKKLKNITVRRTIFLNIVFFRFFNLFNLYEDLDIEPFDNVEKKELIQKFNSLKEQGRPIFNNAYLICSGKPNQKKHVAVIESLEDFSKKIDIFITQLDKAKTPRESLEVIQQIDMVGPFLACEIWTDLTYFDFFKQKWTDNDFVNIGPGAEWGLEIVFGKKLNKKEQYEKLDYLRGLQDKYLLTMHKELNEEPSWNKIKYLDKISITNIEGCLCEFRKYWNIKHGIGKRKYFRPGNFI